VVPQLYKDAGITDDLNAPATTLEENIKKLAQMPLIAQPGAMFDYSNNSVDTLCRLVEVVSGLDYDTYQRRHILEPLKITRPGSSRPTTSTTGSPPSTGRAATRSRPSRVRSGSACSVRSTPSARTRPTSAAPVACTARRPTTSASPRCC